MKSSHQQDRTARRGSRVSDSSALLFTASKAPFQALVGLGINSFPVFGVASCAASSPFTQPCAAGTLSPESWKQTPFLLSQSISNSLPQCSLGATGLPFSAWVELLTGAWVTPKPFTTAKSRSSLAAAMDAPSVSASQSIL